MTINSLFNLNAYGGTLSQRTIHPTTDKRESELTKEVKDALEAEGKVEVYLELSNIQYFNNAEELERYYNQGYKDALKNILTLGLYSWYVKRKYMY